MIVADAPEPMRTCLFAVGSGGNPLRHPSLIEAMAKHGTTVIAPSFERIPSPTPDAQTLTQRARRLDQVLHQLVRLETPVVGVGHSIGAALLLVLAGAIAHTIVGEPVILRASRTFVRLALLAPPGDFFRIENAMASVNVPAEMWVGRKDMITPPSQSEFLSAALKVRTQSGVKILDEAGHFSFMDDLPPHAVDPHPDRQEFLQSISASVSEYVSL